MYYRLGNNSYSSTIGGIVDIKLLYYNNYYYYYFT